MILKLTLILLSFIYQTNIFAQTEWMRTDAEDDQATTFKPMTIAGLQEDQFYGINLNKGGMTKLVFL